LTTHMVICMQMIKKPCPTWAEGSDMANIVLKRVNCIILPRERAKRDHSLQVVCMEQLIARETEVPLFHLQLKSSAAYGPASAIPQKLNTVGTTETSFKWCSEIKSS
jgi:pyruvate kinase